MEQRQRGEDHGVRRRTASWRPASRRRRPRWRGCARPASGRRWCRRCGTVRPGRPGRGGVAVRRSDGSMPAASVVEVVDAHAGDRRAAARGGARRGRWAGAPGPRRGPVAGERLRGSHGRPGRARARRRPARGRRSGGAARRGARRDRPGLSGAAIPASCAARVAVMSSAQLGAIKATASPRPHPELRAAGSRIRCTSASSSAKVGCTRLLPARGVRQHGDRRAVRPAASRLGRAARRSMPGSPRSASGTASIAARSSGSA